MGQQEEALKRAIFCIICMMTRVHGSARLLLWIVSLVVIPGRFDIVRLGVVLSSALAERAGYVVCWVVAGAG